MTVTYRLFSDYAVIASADGTGGALTLDFGKGATGTVLVGDMHLILRDGAAVCPPDTLPAGTYAPLFYGEEGSPVPCEPFTLDGGVTPCGADRAMLLALFTEREAAAAERKTLRAQVDGLLRRVNGTALF